MQYIRIFLQDFFILELNHYSKKGFLSIFLNEFALNYNGSGAPAQAPAFLQLGRCGEPDHMRFTLAAPGKGAADLVPLTPAEYAVLQADKLPLRQLAIDVIEACELIRADDDPKFRKSKELMDKLPWWLMRSFLSLASLSMNELYFDLSKLGLPADLFGTGMVTSLGMHGVDEAYAPLTPIGRIMVDVLLTRVRQRPWVGDDGELSVRPTLKLCATFDHRVVDGVHANGFLYRIGEILEYGDFEL